MVRREQLERERPEIGQQRRGRRPVAAGGDALVGRGRRAATVGPAFFGGQPERPHGVDGQLRRAVAATAGLGRAAAGRRLERMGRMGAVHESVRRRHGRAASAVRQPHAEHVGPAVCGPGHGDGPVQPARVRPRVGSDGGHGAPSARRRVEQRGGHGR